MYTQNCHLNFNSTHCAGVNIAAEVISGHNVIPPIVTTTVVKGRISVRADAHVSPKWPRFAGGAGEEGPVGDNGGSWPPCDGPVYVVGQAPVFRLMCPICQPWKALHVVALQAIHVIKE